MKVLQLCLVLVCYHTSSTTAQKTNNWMTGKVLLMHNIILFLHVFLFLLFRI